jgi:RNA polymerase sigma factor (sigma-70 family)
MGWFMANSNATAGLGKQIRALFDVGALGGLPDRALLDQFARGGETAEAAFATLVERHGMMVLRVCDQLLRDRHLAEDAFQVTFMLLARRARAIHNPDALAGWLHRVARRVAIRAAGGIRLHRSREHSQTGEIAVGEDNRLERAEICAIVHEEIDRLADAQRLPILLCALEGLSHEEAARRLRWPVGTVKSRLVRGRKRLEGRLARRGLAPAVGLAAAIAAQPATAQSMPLALAVATTRVALESTKLLTRTARAVSATGSSSVNLLLQKELGALLFAQTALAAAVAVSACVIVAVIGLTVVSAAGRRPQPAARQTYRTKPAAATSSVVASANSPALPPVDHNVAESPPAIPIAPRQNPIVTARQHRLSPLGEQVERAIRGGVEFLKTQQRPDGSWPDVDNEAKTGLTSLVTLALLAAAEQPNSPAIAKALEYLRQFGPTDLNSTYAISLQTQVFAGAEPQRDILRVAANVRWLERAQFRQGDSQLWPGAWTYSDSSKRARPGDNSNTQFALVGLAAASEAGVPIAAEVWDRSHSYWLRSQKRDGSWAYTPESQAPSASMTCAGIASTVLSSRSRSSGQEFLEGEVVHDCGKGAVDRSLQSGIDWLTGHFQVTESFGSGNQWKLYYLYGLERAARLAGLRFFGDHDWYRAGSEELVREQHRPDIYWQGALLESNKILATSFALLFLAKGRAPVLINKLRYGPGDDWNNDPGDIRNLVGVVSAEWRHFMTWQIVDSKKATVTDLLRAPVLFMSGHNGPEFTIAEKKKLREYIERGGSLFAEACCGRADFDRGFKKLMAELFPEKSDELRPLADDHPIWRIRHILVAGAHPLWGIQHGGRIAVVYSPQDLSCYWNQAERSPSSPAVIKAVRIGQNVIDALTLRKLPADKLCDL